MPHEEVKPYTQRSISSEAEQMTQVAQLGRENLTGQA